MAASLATQAPLKVFSKLMVLVVLVLSVWGVARGASLVQQDLLFTRAQTEISFWGRENYKPTPAIVERTRGQLDTLLLKTPNHPDYLALQASASIWMAYWSPQPASENYSQQAIASQYAALLPRPAHRFSWRKLNQYVSRGEATEANVRLAALAENKLTQLSVGFTP